MISRHLVSVLFALGAVAVPPPAEKVLKGDCSHNGLLWDCGRDGLVWTKGAVRMNHMQVIGSHNSYHVEAPKAERDLQAAFTSAAVDLQYSHAALDVQLEYLHVRNLELDLLADPDGGMYSDPLLRKFARLGVLKDPKLKEKGTKVLHIPDVDYHTTCSTLVSCLHIIKRWMDAHPDSVPLPMMMEFKTAEDIGERLGGAKVVPWTTDLLNVVDEEIRSVFNKSQLITPDDIRRDGLTLEQSILSMPGQGDCAFQKHNDPVRDADVELIQAQVRANYWVRTRADEPLNTVLGEKCDVSRRNRALRSGAHIVSTDFAAFELSSRWGCDYAVRLPGGKAARCNPVNGEGCEGALEPLEYTEN
ncbi:hypothetical protein TrVFT333_004760 [Trichoderma virens FT-333]|nr:hypothetical protein TrVFT333_004760 [Trichoderma virens FT-333]